MKDVFSAQRGCHRDTPYRHVQQRGCHRDTPDRHVQQRGVTVTPLPAEGGSRCSPLSRIVLDLICSLSYSDLCIVQSLSHELSRLLVIMY